jgi:hypothetical protein
MNITLALVFATAFENITRDIGRIFTDPTNGIFGAEPALMGLFIFLILLVLTLIFGLGMLIGSVVLIPSMFLIFQWVPDLKIIVAIIMGLILGMFLNKLIKR